MKRRIMKHNIRKEQRRYRQHQQLKKKGLSYCIKTRYIFIPHERTEGDYPKPVKILKTEFNYVIQQTIE